MEVLFLIGRILYGGYFFLMALNHFMKLDFLSGYAQAKGVPSPKIAVLVSGLLLLIGGLSILVGYQTLVGVAALAVFLIPVSFKMHNFWAIDDEQQKMIEMTNFMKNMALLGAALMFLMIQNWPLSLDG
ncbi:MAG: DoxX family protein [Chloroflexi bacterium]|nr:DoxX family protein [Chloroflexota bacterium]